MYIVIILVKEINKNQVVFITTNVICGTQFKKPRTKRVGMSEATKDVLMCATKAVAPEL